MTRRDLRRRIAGRAEPVLGARDRLTSHASDRRAGVALVARDAADAIARVVLPGRAHETAALGVRRAAGAGVIDARDVAQIARLRRGGRGAARSTSLRSLPSPSRRPGA